MKRVLYIILSILLMQPGFSQVEITDAGLLSCFTEDYPALIINDTQLDILASERILEVSCDDKSVVDLSILEYFSSVKELSLNNNSISDLNILEDLIFLYSLSLTNNNITTIPSLRSSTILTVIDLQGNQLTSLPTLPINIIELNLANNNLKGKVDASVYPNLEKLVLDDNQIDTLNGLPTLSQLKELSVSRNGLKAIETFQNCDNLQTLILEDNNLTSIEGLDYKPQLIDLNLNKNNLTDIYLSTMGESAIVFLQGNALTFSDISLLINESSSLEATVYYDSQSEIEIDSSLTLNHGDYFSWTLDFDQTVFNNTYEWFLNGESIETTTVGVLEINEVKTNFSGKYTCIVSNDEFPDLTLTVSSLKLEVLEEESDDSPLAFNPGSISSGVFNLNAIGEIEIFDRFSTSVRKEDGPFDWDGKNQEGQDLPVGIYVVLINGEFWNQISIIK